MSTKYTKLRIDNLNFNHDINVNFEILKIKWCNYILLIAGLIVWNQTRLQWIGSSRPRNHTQQSREPKLRFVTHYFDILCSDMIAVMQEIYGAKCCPSVKVVANLLDSFLYQQTFASI